MKFAFYFATRQKMPENTQAFTSLTKIKNKTNDKFDIFYSTNNTKGLSVNYNTILNQHKDFYDYIVFLHDDVYVDDFDVCEKLLIAHQDYDIVGLAGGVNPRIQAPALWHIMCGNGNLRGAVAHPATQTSLAMTSFGITPARVAVLDGLFLSVATPSIVKSGWKFNENYTFHHYDIASSLDANRLRLKLGVAPIWVVHNSPGLLNIHDENFNKSQETFLNEYS